MDGYQEFLLTVRRDINCLSDADRMVRRNAAVKLEKLLSGGRISAEFVRRLFREELHKPLFRMFSDTTEKCRELSVRMTRLLVDIIPAEELENMLPLLLAALLGRLRTLPFPEQSEELRLEILQLLRHLFKVSGPSLNPFASDIIDALAKALTDTCPDAKKECCEITKNVAQHFDGERVSRAGSPLIASLLANLRHQQWKVRKATLECLGSLMSMEAPMLDHMEDMLPHLNVMLGDRTPAVRQTLSECLERWIITGLGFRTPLVSTFDDDGTPPGFAKFEHRLLLLLLGGVSDEDTDQVAKGAMSGLERASAKKHEMRKKQAEVARAKEEAKAKAKAETVGPEGEAAKFEPPPRGPVEIEVAPAFDFAAVRGLLPDPFTSGCTPGELSTAFVQLHLPSILPQVLGNLTQWTSDIRIAAARLLRVIVVLVNRQVAPFLDDILVHLYKASADDDKVVATSVMQCAEMVGAFLEVDLVLALVGRHLGMKSEGNGALGERIEDLWPENKKGRQVTRTVQDVSSKNFIATNMENRRQVFAVLAHLLRPAPPALLLGDMRTMLRYLEEGSSSDELLPWIFSTVQALLRAGQATCVEEWPRIFDLLLRMRSGEECAAPAVDSCMDDLASLCGQSRRELYEEHLRARLNELLLGGDVELWDERSSKRHVLETLLRNAGAAVAEHVSGLVPVLARQSAPDDAPVAARIDLLGLVHFLITQEDKTLTEALREHSSDLLTSVLIPNCTWRAGQSNNKIRKGGMVCVHAMLEKRLVAASALNRSFSDLLPILKSCLDDSFAPDNRLIACFVLSCTLTELQAEINSEQLREIYPELLKRLDDSNDKIRMAVCEALGVFFKCLPPKWSRSLYEYILRTLFVHLDDPNPDIQSGIYTVLEAAVHQDYETFTREAQTAAAKSSHPRMCEELARLAGVLRQASGDADGA
jgi:dynein assembly factor 5